MIRPGSSPSNSGAAPTYVTVLPGSPADGQEVYFAADAANGVLWHLRYRAAASGSFKWEFLGGSVLQAEIATSEQTTGQTFADLTTSGPSVTVPLAGDYEVMLGARVLAVGTSNGYAIMSYAIGGTAASDNDNIVARNNNSPETGGNMYRRKIKTALAAATVLLAKYRTSIASTTGTFQDRSITIRPIRVG